MADESHSVGYQKEDKRHPWLKVAFVLTTLLAGLATATQVFARLFAYHEALGPNFRNLYFPGMIIAWVTEYRSQYPVECQTATAYGMAVTAGAFVIYLVMDRVVTQSYRNDHRLQRQRFGGFLAAVSRQSPRSHHHARTVQTRT